MSKKVVVCGAGPAGVMAACTASQNGNDVTLIERNSRIGRKLMITGKGRCNVTNACADLSELIEQVPVNGRFLYSAFSKFMTYDTMELFENLGVPLKIERGERVFPVSDKAVSIVDALSKYIRQSGVHLIEDRVISIETLDGAVTGVRTENRGLIPCDSVVIATGGLSYPTTGSTGDGYKLASSLGHSVVTPTPSLVPIESNDPCCKAMQGLSLRNVGIKITDENHLLYSDFGEMLFTHFGVSGPTILSASSHLRKIVSGKYNLVIDLKPALSEEQLDNRIQRDFEKYANRDFQNSLVGLLPAKMIPVIVEKSGILPEKKTNQITKEERRTLVSLLKGLVISIDGFRPISEAIITSGGVNVKEINPKTMESKLIDGLFFAGEVIDVDAYTGGYNLQIAFSTGYLAGTNI